MKTCEVWETHGDWECEHQDSAGGYDCGNEAIYFRCVRNRGEFMCEEHVNHFEFNSPHPISILAYASPPIRKKDVTLYEVMNYEG